jgi:hypothetical protein
MARAPRYEGSPPDQRRDAIGAKKMGVSKAAYERTAKDRRQDAAGQRAFNKAAMKKGKR